MRTPRVFLLLAIAAAAGARGPSPARANPPPALFEHRAYISPDEIRHSDTRSLAERLVRRIHEECDLAGAADTGERRLGGDFDIIMMVPSDVIGSIRARGFLNQHQTRTTKGIRRLPARFAAEQELAMMRLPYDRKGRELLPKYAILNVRKAGMGAFFLPERYGRVAIVFKNEVAARATWTYADSLDYSRKTGRFLDGGESNPLLTRTAGYPGNKADRNQCGNYCEAQIWGRLDWSDVDYVMVSTAQPVNADVLAAGVPVYRYAASANPGQTAQFVRGERVAAPDAGAAKESPVPGPVDDSPTRSAGDLATKPKSPDVVRDLEMNFASSDPATRAMALYGLSELPWEEFKPRLLAGLADADALVAIQSVALAAERRGDADVSRSLRKLEEGVRKRLSDPMDADARDILEWLRRLERARLCAE
ncbi:MAG: hypothetical protein ACHQ51_14500 [Elusimicrobiota bacterium]